MQDDFATNLKRCRAEVKKIKTNYTAGASELLSALLVAVKPVVNSLPQHRDVPSKITALAREVALAKPFMAPFIRVANILALGAQVTARKGASEGRDYLAAELEKLEKASADARENLSKNGIRLIDGKSSGIKLFTFSRSSIVLELLRSRATVDSRIIRKVVVTECRPGNEGVLMARELAAVGLNVTLITDAAASSYIPGADLVLLGADSVSPLFVVNKIGSRGVAVLAGTDGVPVYVATETSKFLPAELQLLDESGHDPSEISTLSLPNLKIENRYFERVPLSLVAGILTEHGLMKPSDLVETIRALEFTSDLQDWLNTARGISDD